MNAMLSPPEIKIKPRSANVQGATTAPTPSPSPKKPRFNGTASDLVAKFKASRRQSKKAITAQLDEENYKWVERIAKESGLSTSECVNMLIAEMRGSS